MADRQPPHDDAAESAVLGSIIIDGDAIAEIADRLTPADFYSQPNATVYRAALGLYQDGIAVDQVSLAGRLGPELAAIGGPAYLSRLVLSTPTSVHVEHHAATVARLAAMRRLIDAAGTVARLGYEGKGSAAEVYARALAAVTAQWPTETAGVVTPRQQADFLVDHMGRLRNPERRPSWPWGLPDLDRRTGGLYPGELAVIGGPPGIGKSTLLLQVAEHAAQHDRRVLLVSNEMTQAQIAERQIARLTGLTITDVRTGNFSDGHLDTVSMAAPRIAQRQLYLYDSRRCTTAAIRTAADRLQRSVGLDMIVIDYLQLISDQSREGTYARMTGIIHGLKQLALELGVAVVTASQINREYEARNGRDKRPRLSDLRDSGMIEADCDVVAMLWRWDKAYTRETWPLSWGQPYPENQAELLLLKLRQGGATGIIPLVWRQQTLEYGCKA